MMRAWPVIAALLLAASVARGADAPVLAPARGVTVTYRLAGASQQQGAQKLQVTYGDSNRVRMDFFRSAEAPSAFASLIYDPPADRVTTMLPEQQGYVQRDVGRLPSPGVFLNDRMAFTRIGTATIAGQSCTDWNVSNGAAGEGTACVTDDGVVLRATRERPAKGLMEAVTVRYAPPAAELFAPPPNYHFMPSPDFPDVKPPAR